MQQQQQSTPYFNKDGSFLKRIVTEVIAERDAQIAAALFEVAKNQPHLQMMVQTVITRFALFNCPWYVVSGPLSTADEGDITNACSGITLMRKFASVASSNLCGIHKCTVVTTLFLYPELTPFAMLIDVVVFK